MDFPWYLLALAIFGLPVNGYIIEKGPSELILNWTSDDYTYNVNLQENNQINGSDRLLLFTIKEVTSTPNWQYGPGIFAHETKSIENGWEFYITQYIDYESEAAHSYFVTIIIDTDVNVFTINTINYDDEPPTLTAPMCSMKENTLYNETTTECISTLGDPDGWLSQTSFKIINRNSDITDDQDPEDQIFQFSFDRTIDDYVYETTVYLTTLKELDYEKKIFYSFVVQAKDGANHSTTPNENVTCIIDVIDLNDTPPVWTDYFNITEIQEEASYIFKVTAVDGDRGINADITYHLLDWDRDICAESCVAINTENGKGVISVEPIDRDEKDLSTYKFQIMAREVDDPPFNVTLNITFFIDDIDDNSPLFMNITHSNDTNITFHGENKIAEFTFYENFAGTIDGAIFIQDIDTGVNAQFTVELLEDESKTYDVEYTDAFLIIPSAGYRNGIFQISVKNFTYLDFENKPWQNFSFYVHSEGKNESRQDNLSVKIHLLDYNDELPKFANASYTTKVKETIKLGEEIIRVKATDRDAEDDILRHELVGANVIISLITIDSAEGIITVAQNNAFDYDRINPVIFQVQASDKVNHTATVSVVVNLLDVNNKAPTYKVQEDVIRVDENQIIGIELNASITASDVDTTRNLTAEINWEKSYVMKNSQKLNSSNSVIRQAMQFLSLSYSKLEDDSISIKLIVNDNNPEGTAPDYETFDTLYLDINITDLNTELPEFADKMSIDALIVININDINDNPPIFTEDTLKMNRTIYEKSKNGTIVGTIVAIDADVGDVVTYSCTYLDEKLDWFSCDKNGQISAKTANIDADSGPVKYVSINCSATDGYWITPQVFEIYILDTNNQWPQIKVNHSLNTQVVEIKEKSKADTIVTLIDYKDADRDAPFHTVECRINRTEECFESFKIEDNVLKVSIGEKDLDRDTNKAQYTCTPTCYDNPNLEQNDGQNLNTSAKFIIKLIDINDHCPEMITRDLEVKETLMQGDIIGKIVAEDLDEGNNSEIVMNILTVTKLDNNEDYTDLNLFKMVKDEDDYYINSTRKQWHLVANKDLRDYYGQYTLQLNLTDLGTPPQSTEDANNTEYKEKARLSLFIRKFNYYPPVFVFPNSSKLNFSLSSEQVPGKPLAMYYNEEKFGNIEITDGENESCIDKWDPQYSVALVNMAESATNFFELKYNTSSKCTAQLQVNDLYDKSEALHVVSYQLRLTASLANESASEHEAEYSESINLKMYFVNLNDDPVFNVSLGPWNISFQEDNDAEFEDLPQERKAYYPNVDNSDELTKCYFLKSDDQVLYEIFDLEQNTGQIKLKKKLDYLEKKNYEFQIQASRNQTGLGTKTESRMNVIVNVIDINNHVPQWTEESFFGAILITTQKESTIVTLHATDLDEIDRDKLTYSLNSTFERHGSDNLNDISDPFSIDSQTGKITLNFQIDYNMNGYFVFWVKVQDVKDDYGHGPFENITSVTIHIVTDDYIVTFRFENTLDIVVKKKAKVLATISDVLEWDCHDQVIDNDSKDGVKFDNVTAAKLYCENNNTPLTSDDLKTKLNNIDTFQQLKQDLLEFGILLQNFNSDNSNSIDNLQNTLKIALIAVSVVLGALCLILAVTFFLKNRDLNRRLQKLTNPKFGSDESNLNRKGINAPTTNIFAVEGSNPVFNTNLTKEDLGQNERLSIQSTNSELIGVEDSPEFDDMFGEKKY